MNWAGYDIQVGEDAGFAIEQRRIQAIVDMDLPRSLHGLGQLFHIAVWCQGHISNYAELIEPLSTFMKDAWRKFEEKNPKKVARRSSQNAKRINLAEYGWDEQMDAHFEALREGMVKGIRLTFYDPELELAIIGDASENYWAVGWCQFPREDRDKPFAEIRFSFLTVNSGAWKGAEMNWAMVDKEGFVPIKAMRMYPHLATLAHFVVWTDHNNLTKIFDPCPTTPKTATMRRMRWLEEFEGKSYEVEHVAGEDNNAFDLLSRGGSVAHREDDFVDGTVAAIQVTGEPFVYDYNETGKRAAAVRVVTETALANDGDVKPARPKFGPRDMNVAKANGEPFTFELPREAYPSFDNMGEAQDSVSATEIETHKLQQGREGSAHAGLWVTKDDDVYVPDADKLRMRCTIVAHQGAGLHRKVDAMYTSIRAAKCWWPNMRETLKELAKLCMCCVWTMEGKRIPRATVETLYATQAGEAVTMDFLYIGPSDSGHKYILVLKDMCSQRVRLVNCVAADSGSATDALIEWCADFGTPDLLVSDQGAHFVNSTLEEVNRILGIEHHWTTPYNARSNGSVERVNREYLKAIRAMRIETKTPVGRWPDLTNVIQYGINTQPLQCLNGLSALEVDGARNVVGPLGYALRTGANIKETDVARIDPKKMQATVARLRKATASMQAMATDNKRERAKRARERRERVLGPKKRTALKAKTKGDISVPEDGNQTFWFHQGQFVMVAERSNKDRKSKLEAKWRGPYVIDEMVTDHRARVHELTLDEKKKTRSIEVASDRMRLWAERDYLVPYNVLEGAQYASDVFEIESFHDWRPSTIKGETDKFQLLCKWKGYELDRGEEGWVNLDDVYATAYRLVNGMGDKGWEGTELTTKLKKHIATLEAERADGK